MAEWNPDWERKLAEPPLPGKRFTEDMKMEVLNRLEGRTAKGGWQENRRLNRVRLRGSFVAGVLVVMLAVPGTMVLWQGVGADGQPGTMPVPNQGQGGPNGFAPTATPDGVAPSPISMIREGDGGNLAWWREWSPPERTVSDTTLVAFVQALLEKRMGAMGGPESIDALWERVEDKQVLDRYELSSPWVEEVYVEEWHSEVKQHETKFDSQTQGPWTVYELRLVLTDSTQSVLEENLLLHIDQATGKIHSVTVKSDETADEADTSGDGIVPTEGIQTSDPQILAVVASMELNLTRSDVLDRFGDKYVEVVGAMDGEPIWRFDYVKDEGYEVKNLDLNGVVLDSGDLEGLQNGSLHMQLFITWNEAGRVQSYSLLYKGDDGNLYHFRFYGDNESRLLSL